MCDTSDATSVEYDTRTYADDKEIRDERELYPFMFFTRNEMIRKGYLTGEIDPEEEITREEPIEITKIEFKQLELEI